MKNFSAQQILGFDDRKFMLLGLPLSSIMISLLLFPEQWEANRWGFVGFCLLISLFYNTLYWAILRTAYLKTARRFPQTADFRKRITIMVFVFLGAYFVINFLLDGFVHQYLMPLHTTHPHPIVVFLAAFLLSALVIVTYEASSFHIQLNRAEAARTELEKHYAQSQLEGLRNQVNPHFLFNSLNTLIYLIPENAEKAVRFVRQLSKVYRYVLESREAHLIPLADELEFLEAYIFLQKERFGNNFRVQIAPEMKNDAAKSIKIVPLTLQMLFENAIKHNIISTAKPLVVELFTTPTKMVVRNNLQPKQQVSDSTGVGLTNIKNRYRMLTGEAVEILVSQEYFTVLLPLLTINDK